jgi:hypothetical protein
MRNQFVSSLLLSGFLFGQHGQTQTTTVQSNLVAQKIAKKMKDTLGLSSQQRSQVFQINMNLNDQKHRVRQQIIIQDSLCARIQGIENKRDTLYFPILGTEKYLLYQQKKRNLVNNN